MTVEQYIAISFKEYQGFCFRNRIVCNDGFCVSVQASKGHYCQPRETIAKGYISFELGYPSDDEELLIPYAEDEERPTDTVYPYTPAEVVQNVVDKHGGIDIDKTFNI